MKATNGNMHSTKWQVIWNINNLKPQHKEMKNSKCKEVNTSPFLSLWIPNVAADFPNEETLNSKRTPICYVVNRATIVVLSRFVVMG